MQELLNKIKQAHEQGYTDKSLSLALAKDKSYIAQIKKGVSTAKQAQLIKDIDAVLNGEVFKNDAQIIAELSQKLSEAQDAFTEERKVAEWLQNRVELLDNELDRLAELQSRRINISIRWQQKAIKYRNYTMLLSTALVLGILSFITYLFI